MAELENIVSVSITAETTTVQTANFNIPLIIAEFNNFTDSRTRTYGSAADVASDFAASSNVYIMAQKVFGQNQKPAQLVVGRKLAAEDYTTAYNAIKQENDGWFGVLAETHVPAQQLLLAAVVEADSKVYITSTQAADALTTATTDVGSQLKALGYDQTAVIYSVNADTQFPEAAWAGSQLTYVPGSNTWKFKSLDGVTVDNLTPTQIANLRAKNMNFYISVGGVSITEDGKMVSGRWIDEIILVAWTEARMKESVFGMMINQAKVPFTNAGIAMVEAQIRSVLSQGVANGGYSSYTVTSPRLSDIPASRRNGRIAGDFKFRAVLAGAIHQVVIVGTVTTDTTA